MKKDIEILNILRRTNELPAREVKENVDSMRMTFSDWEKFTNHRIAGYDARDLTKRQLTIIEDKASISYDEYLAVRASCHRYMELSDNSNRAKMARGRKDTMQKEIEAGEISAESVQLPPEEEVQMLEEIERLWREVRTKYDPVMEISRISNNTIDILEYGTSSDRLDYSIRTLKENMEGFQSATTLVGELYEKNQECLDLDFELITAMAQGLRGLETLQGSENLSVDAFMQMLALNSEEVLAHFKGRMELAAKSPSARPSIMANEGKAFRINDEGKLEIIDPKRAKDEIADVYFADSFAKEPIGTLARGSSYKQLTQNLPERKKLSNDEISRLMGVVDQPFEIINWMVKNPHRVFEMIEALSSQGVQLDMDSIISDMQDEVDDPYFDPDYDIDDDRIATLQQILDQFVDRDLENDEYDEHDEDFFRELYEMEEAEKHRDDDYEAPYINESGEIIRPGATEPQNIPQTNVDEELLKWLDSGSPKTTEDLKKQILDNEATIAGNEETIKAELLNTILRQQRKIAEQEAEIKGLRSQKEI